MTQALGTNGPAGCGDRTAPAWRSCGPGSLRAG
jgi:hypothetical protein